MLRLSNDWNDTSFSLSQTSPLLSPTNKPISETIGEFLSIFSGLRPRWHRAYSHFFVFFEYLYNFSSSIELNPFMILWVQLISHKLQKNEQKCFSWSFVFLVIFINLYKKNSFFFTPVLDTSALLHFICSNSIFGTRCSKYWSNFSSRTTMLIKISLRDEHFQCFRHPTFLDQRLNCEILPIKKL